MNFSRAPIKASISKDLFDRIDIRAGTIRRVEEVAKSRKLVKLVDFVLRHPIDTRRHQRRARESR